MSKAVALEKNEKRMKAMKVSKLVGERFKEKPADCVIDSHALMVKGGYIKYVANGIYSLFTPGKRVTSRSSGSSAKRWMRLTVRK